MNYYKQIFSYLQTITDEKQFIILLKNRITFFINLMIKNNAVFPPNKKQSYYRLNDIGTSRGLEGGLRVSRVIIDIFEMKKVFNKFSDICKKYYSDLDKKMILYLFIDTTKRDIYEDLINKIN